MALVWEGLKAVPKGPLEEEIARVAGVMADFTRDHLDEIATVMENASTPAL